MVAHLAWIVLLGLAQVPEPDALVRRLGSPRYAEREQAAVELERLGRDALEALRAGRQARDPEIRTRSAALYDKIEGALLTRPTLITLDFQDRPLAEVVDEINRRAGAGLSLQPENNANWAGRRVTLVESEPVPFWSVVDRLCEAGQLQFNFGFQVTPGRPTTLPLYEGAGRVPGPVVDSGPFRVNLTGLHYQRDVMFMIGAGQPMPFRAGLPRAPGIPAEPRGEAPAVSVNELFSINLQVAAEPRLMLQQNGAARLAEAVDDQGQSLLPQADNGAVQRFSGYMGFNSVPVVQLQVPLARPEAPGKVIRKLRGTIPVAVSSRKPDPTVVPLTEGVQKTFRNEEAEITLVEVKPHANNAQTMIELLVRPLGDAPMPAGDGNAVEFAGPRQDLVNQQRIEILDAKENALPWFPSNIRLDQEGTRMTLLLPNHGQGAPTTLRYHAMVWASAQVPFEFRDLPMP